MFVRQVTIIVCTAGGKIFVRQVTTVCTAGGMKFIGQVYIVCTVGGMIIVRQVNIVCTACGDVCNAGECHLYCRWRYF